MAYGDKRKHSDKGMDATQKMLDKTGGETPCKVTREGGSGKSSSKSSGDKMMNY